MTFCILSEYQDSFQMVTQTNGDIYGFKLKENQIVGLNK